MNNQRSLTLFTPPCTCGEGQIFSKFVIQKEVVYEKNIINK
jgi:hypothetical protein